MNKELFIDKFNNKDATSIKVVVNNAEEYVAEVVVKDGDSFYQGTVHKTEGYRVAISGDIKEVIPVEVTTTEYQEILTLRGTKQELVHKLYEALKPEIEFFHSDVSEPYAGSIVEYERVSEENVLEVAEEVIKDIFSIGGQ